MNKEEKQMHRMKYFIEGLSPEVAKIAEVELGETEEIKQQCLKELKRLIKEEPDFYPCMDDAFLLRYLRTKKFKVEKAFNTLKNYYLYKARYSGIVTDIKPSEVKSFLEQYKAMALEYRDENYVAIGYLRVGDLDVDRFPPDTILSAAIVVTEVGTSIEATQVTGYIMIIDFENFTLRKAKDYASPSYLYRLVTAIQDCIPCRIKGYHIVNEPLYFNIIYSVVKPFLSEKLSKRIYLHGSNLKGLYKYVTPDILPEELGGKQGPMAKFGVEYARVIQSKEEHVIKMNKFGFQGKTLQQLRKEHSNQIIT